MNKQSYSYPEQNETVVQPNYERESGYKTNDKKQSNNSKKENESK